MKRIQKELNSENLALLFSDMDEKTKIAFKGGLNKTVMIEEIYASATLLSR